MTRLILILWQGFSVFSLFAAETTCPLSTNLYFWDRLMEIRRDARSAFDQIEIEQRDFDKETALFKMLVEPHKKGSVPEREYLEAEKNLKLAEWELQKTKILYKETKAKEKVAELHAKCIKNSEEAIDLLESYGGVWQQRFDHLALQETESVHLVDYESSWLQALKKAAKEGSVSPKSILEHEFRVKHAKYKLRMARDELATTKDALEQIKEQIKEVRLTRIVDLDSIILSPPHVD